MTKKHNFITKKGHGMIGREPQAPDTWVIRIIRTKEILAKYRNIIAAKRDKGSFESIVFDKCEVVRNGAE